MFVSKTRTRGPPGVISNHILSLPVRVTRSVKCRRRDQLLTRRHGWGCLLKPREPWARITDSAEWGDKHTHTRTHRYTHACAKHDVDCYPVRTSGPAVFSSHAQNEVSHRPNLRDTPAGFVLLNDRADFHVYLWCQFWDETVPLARTCGSWKRNRHHNMM